MPNVFKSFWGAVANDYIFKPAEELKLDEFQPIINTEPAAEDAPETLMPEGESSGESNAAEEDAPAEEEKEPTPEEDPVFFARIQAEAILEDARREAESYREQLRVAFEAECEQLRKAARDEGYNRGYAEGMATAMREGEEERQRMALEQIKGIEAFLEAAARTRDRILDDAREELKEMALAIAEKVIHVSLQNNRDIIQRMVDAATDTHKHCEWAHIYVAGCNVGGKAYTVPELVAGLSHIADRVKVIPMPDEEDGTCIVELPDVILDTSVSTQLDNLREVLDGVPPDKDQ